MSNTQIVKVSPKGQITIPVAHRQQYSFDKYLMEFKGSTIVMMPIEIKVIREKPAKRKSAKRK